MSIQEELESIRCKIRLFKERNKRLSEKSSNVSSNFGITNDEKFKRKRKEYPFFSVEEARIVNFCFMKCVEMLQKSSKERQKKKKLNEHNSLRKRIKYSKSADLHLINDSKQLGSNLCKHNKNKSTEEDFVTLTHFSKISKFSASGKQEEIVPLKSITNNMKNNAQSKSILLLNDKSERSSVEYEAHDVIYLETMTCEDRKRQKNVFERRRSKNIIRSNVNNKVVNNDSFKQKPDGVSNNFSLPVHKNKTAEANNRTIHYSETTVLDEEKCKQMIQKSSMTKIADIVGINLEDNPKINAVCFDSEKSNMQIQETSSLFSKTNQFSFNENNYLLLSHKNSDLDCQDTEQTEDVSIIAEVKNVSDVVQVDQNEEETIITEWDFTEEPIDFAVPFLHSSETVKVFSTKKVSSLLSKNIPIKKGKWSKEEIALLKRNFNDFKCQFKIWDTRTLLGIGRNYFSNKTETLKIKKFLRAKHFYVRLGKDLNNRILHDVYYKARRLFDPLQIKNKSKKDSSILFQLQKQHGNNWQLIARKFGKSALYCHNLYFRHKNSHLRGRWSREEEERLYNVVQSINAELNLSPQNSKGLSWQKIAKLVGTRSSDQCYSKWNNCMTLFYSKFKYPRWSWKNNWKLVHLLKNEFSVNDEENIKWERIYKQFLGIVPSAIHLKQKFHKIKSYVPKELRGFYPDMIDFLFNKYKQKWKNSSN